MTTPRPTVVLFDDEPQSFSALRMALEDEFDRITACDAETAGTKMEKEWVQMVICDQRKPGRTGVGLHSELRDRWSDTVRTTITGHTDPAAMAQTIIGARSHQFLMKPWHPEQFLTAARSVARHFQLSRDNERLAFEISFLATLAQSQFDKRRAVADLTQPPSAPTGGTWRSLRKMSSMTAPPSVARPLTA